MHTTRRMHRCRGGYALLSAITMAAIFLLMGTAILALSGSSLRASYRRLEAARSLNVAMGVLDDGIERRRADKTYTGNPSFTVNGMAGVCSITVAPVASPAGRVQVVGQATTTGAGYNVVRTIRATLDLDPLPPVYYDAFASKDDFTINGNVDTNSSPTVEGGNVHTNSNLILNGSAVDIHGKATASGSITSSGSPNVTRGSLAGVAPMLFPDIDDAFKAQALPNGISVGNKSVNDPAAVVQGKIIGNLTIGASGCTITGVVWVTGSLAINGPVYGNGTIVCEGLITVDARTNYAATSANNAFITTSTDTAALDLGGNRQAKGIFYAPYGGVKLHGTPTLYGGIMAKSITISGTPTVIRSTVMDSGPPPLPPAPRMKGWEEI